MQQGGASPLSLAWFESESTSATTYCTSNYTKILGYFSIIQTLFMEFDQLLVRE